METVESTTAMKEIVSQAIDYLRQKVQVRRAILFGSHARGEADEWSDVDLAVISPDFARMRHREVMDLLVEVSLAVTPALEVRPYTPRDLKEARPTNFLGHILAEGRVVYADDQFLL